MGNQLASNFDFGTITPPTGVQKYDAKAGGLGLLAFISNLVVVATVFAGLWVFLNFILAGYTYITAQGDSGAHQKVRDKITMSVIGLIIIIVANLMMALLGLLFAGDASYFINPVIKGP